jgi:putative peptidoglycan lipid II flippase
VAEPAPGPPAEAAQPRGRTSAGRARNTAIFSVLTGLSRIAGLGREIVAAAYYGTGGAASAFTLAFQIPNLIRALVADGARSCPCSPSCSSRSGARTPSTRRARWRDSCSSRSR